MDRDRHCTRLWKLYEEGRSYNERLTPNQYSLVETNTEFFSGNQWLHLPDTPAMRGLPKPTFNILKRIASLFIASMTGSAAAIWAEAPPCVEAERVEEIARFASAEMENLLDRFKFPYRLRDALFDGAQTGDYAAHFWFDPSVPGNGPEGEIRMELVDGIRVMFGNPNNRAVEEQPYILITGRDSVRSLQREADAFQRDSVRRDSAKWDFAKLDFIKTDNNRKTDRAIRADGEMISDSEIQSDRETGDFPATGGRVELEGDENGKALYVLLYEKKTGRDGTVTVHVSKAVRNAVIYENVDTGLSRYPLAWGNWEKQKYQYHGRALITGMIPNQIFINTMFATAMRHLQLMAFPKTIYNADLISAWSNEVGGAVGIRGLQPGQNIASVAANLQPAEMSGQIFTLIDKAMAYTRECLGATEVQMGSVRPDNTSALMLLQTNAEIPLENIRAGVEEWAEDIGLILLDFMGTYYGRRGVAIRTDGKKRRILKEFDFSVLKEMRLQIRVEIDKAKGESLREQGDGRDIHGNIQRDGNERRNGDVQWDGNERRNGDIQRDGSEQRNVQWDRNEQ